MKSQKVIALLLSTALSISTCMPLGNITALGAETGATVQTVEVQEEASDSAENAESPQEESQEKDSSEAEAAEQAAEEANDSASETLPEDGREESAEEAETEEDEDDADSDESNAAVPAQEAESSEAEDNDSNQEKTPVQADNKAPDGAETIRKDAMNSGSDPSSVSDSGSGSETGTGRDPNSWSDSDGFSNYVEIKAGDVKTADFSGGNSFVLYRFTPEETADYIFGSSSSGNTYAELYDSSLSFMGMSDDDDDLNFRFYETFYEGETYYFKVGTWDSDLTSFKVHLRKPYFSYESVGDEYRAVSPGETVSLEVKAESSSEISYQWYDPDYNPIEGANSSTYTFKPQKSGSYYCDCQDEDGHYGAVYYRVEIENHLAVFPEGQNEWDNSKYIYASLNETVDLNVTVTADDMSGITYQWRNNDGLIDGANSTSCTTAPVTEYDFYRCDVTDQYGNFSSANFYIYVENHLNAYPEGEDEYTDRTVIHAVPNQTVDLKAIVTADDMTGITYTWYDDNGDMLEGADSTTCTVGPVTKPVNYRLQVTDQYDGYAVVYFHVVAENNLNAYTVDDEGNETRWRNIYVAPNGTAELNATVTADDMEGLTYYWTDDDGNPVDGAGTTSCIIKPVTKSKTYYLYVSDQYKNSQRIVFNIYVKNDLTAYVEDEYGNQSTQKAIYVTPGGTAELNVTVSAVDMDNLTYSWTDQNGNPIENAGTTSCTVGPVTNFESYYFTVSDQYGNNAYVSFSVLVENHLTAYTEDEYGYQTDWATVYTAPNETAELNAFVTADDMEGLTYKWTDSAWNPIEGAGTASCTVGPVTEAETYHLEVFDPYGNMASVYFTVRIENHLNAYTQDEYGEPANWATVYAAPNNTAALNVTVSADDMEGLTYEWTDNNGNPVEGAGTTSCTVGPVTQMNYYYFRVSDRYGNQRSVTFNVRVDNHLTAYTEDEYGDHWGAATFHVAPNDTIELNVTVSADDMEGLTYEWTDNNGNPVEGAGTTSCTVGPISQSDWYNFRVSDRYGNSTNVSFTLLIENHLNAYVEDEYGNTTQWPTVYVAPNGTVELSAIVTADDMEGLTYEWTDSNGNPVEGAGTTSCTIGPVTKSENYGFSVSDSYGNTAYVRYDIHVENHLNAYTDDKYGDQTRWATVYAAPKETLELNVTVSADDMEGLTYEWTDDNGNPVEGAGTTSCTVGPVTKNENYTFRVFDRYGNDISVVFYIRVENHLQAYTTIYSEDGEAEYTTVDRSMDVALNESVDLNVTVTADDMDSLTYEWTDSSGNPVEGASDTSRTVGPVTKMENYTFTVRDQYGNSASVYFNIRVQNHLEAYTTYTEDGKTQKTDYLYLGIAPNTSTEMNVTVSADDMEGLTYEWTDDNGNPVEGAGTTSCTVGPITKRTYYYFRVSDPYGNSSSVYFTFYVENHLTVYPEGGEGEGDDEVTLHAAPGQPLDLKAIVSADETENLTYKWYIDDKPVDGNNQSTYRIDSVTSSNAYRLEVEDPYGNYRHAYFNVIAENHLRAYAEGTDNSRLKTVAVTPGEAADLKVIASADDMSDITYTWYYLDDWDLSNPIAGAVSDTYHIDAVTQQKNYRCYVKDKYGSKESVIFYVNAENHLRVYPEGESEDSYEADIYVPYGSSLELNAIVDADDKTQLTYEWRDNYDYLIEGNNTASFKIESVKYRQRYELQVTDQYGNWDRASFHVHVQNHLNVYPQDEDKDSSSVDIYVPYGESADLKAALEADDQTQLEYSWFDGNGDRVSPASPLNCQTDPIHDHEQYYISVEDQYGNYDSLYFNIYVQNHLTAYPEGGSADSDTADIRIQTGQTAALKAIVSADDADGLRYSWARQVYDSEGDDYYYNYISGAKTDSYTTDPLTEDQTYRLRVYDKYSNYKDVFFNVTVGNLEKQTISSDETMSLPYGSSGTISVSGAQGKLNFTSSNSSVASVDSTGKVTANKVGTAKITIFADATDTYSQSNKITVTVTVTGISIKDAVLSGIEDRTYNGSAQTQTPVVKLGSATLTEGTDYTVSYSDNVNAGKASMTITGTGNYTGTAPAAEFTINPASIKDADVTGLEDKTYNGEEQKPTPVVKLGSATLVNETDYTVSYSDNINAGKATVTITGKGNYTGSASPAEFTINPATIEGAEVTGIVDKTYDGSAQTQTPVVKVGPATLVEGTDYTLTYSNNVEEGTATVTITGIGNYTGVITRDFTISDKLSIETAEVDEITGLIYSGEEQKPTPVVKIGSATLEEGTDYTVDSYSNNINAGTATVTITGKGSYINSKTIEFTISPAPISSTDISGLVDKTYNGKQQTQTPVVKFGSATLAEGTDYTVSYSNNINAGTDTAKVTFTAADNPNFTGTVDKTFTINKADQNFTVKAAASSIDVGKTTKVTVSGAQEKPAYTFTSSNAKVATVNAAGTVTGKAAGTVTITVKTAETANYKTGSNTVKITVNKVLKKPGNCHFIKWNNSKYTGCRIGWKKTEGADGYQTLLSWTDGSHASSTIVKSNVLYRDCTVHPQHVSQMKVRAFYMQNGQRKYGPWSNIEYITPSPAKLTSRNVSTGTSLKMNVSWNIIYGCNGYNVFITTNPNGKWYWYQSTSQKATATSAVINKCGGSPLKKNTRYYVRIVTRRKRNGVFCTVPMPANNTYVGSFVIK